MEKFPSIGQFRSAVYHERQAAQDEGRVPAKRKFRGSVKLHGTNAGVNWASGEELTFHSRRHELFVGDDNAGFLHHFKEVEPNQELKYAMVDIALFNNIDPNVEISIYGEWCGNGIHSGVAISTLPKMFVVFAAFADGRWLDVQFPAYPRSRIYCANSFQTFEIEIDFDKPEFSQAEMVKITEAVERRCPVGSAFGLYGTGEGVVWSPLENNCPSRWFKVKGQDHSISKVKTLAAVDVERFEKKEELVASLATDNRLQQGIEDLGLSLDMRNMKELLSWVFADIQKEETDTIEKNGFKISDLNKSIAVTARRFFQAKVREAEQ